jgi:hypothetical protein
MTAISQRACCEWLCPIDLCISLFAPKLSLRIAPQVASHRLSPLRALSTMIIRNRQSGDRGAERQELRTASARNTGWGDKLVMLIALAGGSLGLTYFAGHVARLHQSHESDKHPGASAVSHVEPVRIWLPQTLVEVAKRRTSQPPIQTHEELQRVLEVEQLRDVWYAVTMREHHDNGEFNDLTVIRWPYNDPRLFPEFPQVLAAAAGKPRSDSAVDFSFASVCVVVEDFRERTPYEVLGEALGSRVR